MTESSKDEVERLKLDLTRRFEDWFYPWKQKCLKGQSEAVELNGGIVRGITDIDRRLEKVEEGYREMMRLVSNSVSKIEVEHKIEKLSIGFEKSIDSLVEQAKETNKILNKLNVDYGSISAVLQEKHNGQTKEIAALYAKVGKIDAINDRLTTIETKSGGWVSFMTRIIFPWLVAITSMGLAFLMSIKK